MSGESGMDMPIPAAEPKPKSPGPKLAAIIAPVVVIVFLLVVGLCGWWWWWLVKRRKERERADTLTQKAQWMDQGFCDGIKAQMMGLDPSKLGLSGDHDRGGGTPAGPHGGGTGTMGTQTVPKIVTSRTPSGSGYATPHPSPRVNEISGGTGDLPTRRLFSGHSIYRTHSVPSLHSAHSTNSVPTDLDSPEFELSSSEEEDSPASTIKASRLRTANGKAVLDHSPQLGTATTLAAGPHASGERQRVYDDVLSPPDKRRVGFLSHNTDETGDNHGPILDTHPTRRVSMVRRLSRALTQVVAQHDSAGQMHE